MPAPNPRDRTPSRGGPLRGGCLCNAVRYQITGVLGPLGHCHCGTCRKSHAAAFATTARVAWSDFEWLAGRESIQSYESSPGKQRSFCGACGSPILAAWDGDDELILRLGSLFDDPGTRPVVHIWTEERAAWFELGSALPTLPRGASQPDASATEHREGGKSASRDQANP